MYADKRNPTPDTWYRLGFDLYVGVPDSLLKKSISSIKAKHVIAVNEAHAVAIAFGAMLAGKSACVYLQNSGLGNIINPITSLCMPAEIYPFLVIGHRHSLPQHKVMGNTDKAILDIIGYTNYMIVEGDNNAK